MDTDLRLIDSSKVRRALDPANAVHANISAVQAIQREDLQTALDETEQGLHGLLTEAANNGREDWEIAFHAAPRLRNPRYADRLPTRGDRRLSHSDKRRGICFRAPSNPTEAIQCVVDQEDATGVVMPPFEGIFLSSSVFDLISASEARRLSTLASRLPEYEGTSRNP
jgi:hypothetical protein